MSRFFLALKACFVKAEESTGSLIFDEIDAQKEVGQFTQDEPQEDDEEVEQEEV